VVLCVQTSTNVQPTTACVAFTPSVSTRREASAAAAVKDTSETDSFVTVNLSPCCSVLHDVTTDKRARIAVTRDPAMKVYTL